MILSGRSALEQPSFVQRRSKLPLDVAHVSSLGKALVYAIYCSRCRILLYGRPAPDLVEWGLLVFRSPQTRRSLYDEDREARGEDQGEHHL